MSVASWSSLFIPKTRDIESAQNRIVCHEKELSTLLKEVVIVIVPVLITHLHLTKLNEVYFH